MKKYILAIVALLCWGANAEAAEKMPPYGSIEIYPIETRCTVCNRIERISWERLKNISCFYTYMIEDYCSHRYPYFREKGCDGQIIFSPVSIKIPKRGREFSAEERLRNIECNYCKELFTMEESAGHICPKREEAYINKLNIYQSDAGNYYYQCFYCLQIFQHKAEDIKELNSNNYGICNHLNLKIKAQKKISLKEKIMEHSCYQGVQDLIKKQVNIDVETEKAKIAEVEREEELQETTRRNSKLAIRHLMLFSFSFVVFSCLLILFGGVQPKLKHVLMALICSVLFFCFLV